MGAEREKCRSTWLGTNYGVAAIQRLEAGESLFVVEGVAASVPSRYSIQMGKDLHVGLSAGVDPAHDLDRYPYCFLNHSCRPNAMFVGRELVAVRPIEPGEEIAFNYNTTEYEMNSPFRCECGFCEGQMIRGFKYLDPSQKLDLYPFLAAHLRHHVRAGVTQ